MPDNLKVKIKDDGLFITYLPILKHKDYLEGRHGGFEIEDYFPDELLKEQGKLIKVVSTQTDLDGNNSKEEYQKFSPKNKMDFANSISSLDNTKGTFNNFEILFNHLKFIISYHQVSNEMAIQ